MQSPINIVDSGKNRAPTIALLTIGAIDPNSRTIWKGAAAAARDNGVNLICYPGRLVKSPVEFEAQRNVIYKMADARTVDGLVIMGGLNAWLSIDATYAFLRQFAPRPIITTGIVLEGIPSVTVNNYGGMREVITHLIKVHGHHRIAFVRGQAGHQEAIDRYQAYLDVLSENNIPFDPELVFQGNFKESSGFQGAKVLIEERKVKFDALAAASDNMAIGAMKELKALGYSVPGDIAIAGVNGEEQGLVIDPPLTTALLHFYEQAYQATTTLLSLMNGKEVPSKVILPTHLVVRQSCGCSDLLVTHAEASPHTKKLDSFTDEIRQLEDLVFGSIDMQANEMVQREFPSLLKSFLDESRGKTEGKFIAQFTNFLQSTDLSNDTFPRWHEIISILRQFTISQLTDSDSRLRVENLVQQVRVVLGESSRRHNAYQVFQADEKLHVLGEISQSLSVTTSISELSEILKRSLTLLNISSCYLFLYEDPAHPEDKVRFIFSFNENGQPSFEPKNKLYPSRQLLPDNFLNTNQPLSLVVEPLYFREDQLGYAIFEADPEEEAIYEILGGQISASLKRTFLTEKNIRLFEEAVKARKTAEQANLLKSRFLSTVSHELRTPLALIVGTIEMMLQEEKTGVNPRLPEQYRKDMGNIHSSAKHLFRLIGDVLDLASNQAGELRLSLELLDLSPFLIEVASQGQAMAREKGLEWREQIPTTQLFVQGDRTRLRQVLLNLINNSVKFTESGYVSLKVHSEGDFVLVEVSDSGMGIPVEEQEVIFDEFHRSERSVARGYGGMGLGLAISRRLIELHGGEIGVRSTGVEETGSVFYFRLPLISTTSQVVKTHDNLRSIVLILSDNPSTQLKKHLIRKGFEVEMMDVSKESDWLTRITSQPPGAVVLDYQPATERGWELLQMLKLNSETKDIPVIFYSLSADDEQGSMLEIDYLSKPINSQELTQTLNRLGLKTTDTLQTILVVDDDPKVLNMHVRMLENKFNCHILTANGGKNALAMIQNENISLVLLDLMMPEVDGFEVLRKMREQEATRNIPVIVLTAQILTSYDMQRLQEGVTAVLNKGLFTVDEVLTHVEETLNHSKRLGSQTSHIVRQVMAYIHENYAESITRADLAKHVCVTERYLTHCFHQEMGITPMAYLNRYRMKRAKMLLEQGKLNITEIALAVGFADSSYFNRVFRQEAGMTPGEYQRSWNKDKSA
jgi:signal transduction histidine kinase/DNA-binding LacI/PurR family transcriptional regulator/CheY-like chemotaxis protein